MKHYVVISSDCHAGPNSPEYRQYLDPQYLEEFDYELAHRDELIAERRAAAGHARHRQLHGRPGVPGRVVR